MSTKAFEEAHETVCDKAVLDLLAAIDFENLTDIQRKQLKIVKILLKAADDIRQVLNPMEIGGIATGASQGEYIMPPTKNFHTKNRELLKKVETSTEPAIVGNTVLAAVLLEQLDKWISDCQLQADVFFERGMTISEASSLAMKVAYMNVKTLVENSR